MPPLPPSNNEPEKPAEALAQKAKSAYKWWDNLSTINAEDPLWVGAVKILARVVGILVLLAMSPLILLGLLLAFIVVA
jgi:hypothetical protein